MAEKLNLVSQTAALCKKFRQSAFKGRFDLEIFLFVNVNLKNGSKLEKVANWSWHVSGASLLNEGHVKGTAQHSFVPSAHDLLNNFFYSTLLCIHSANQAKTKNPMCINQKPKCKHQMKSKKKTVISFVHLGTSCVILGRLLCTKHQSSFSMVTYRYNNYN